MKRMLKGKKEESGVVALAFFDHISLSRPSSCATRSHMVTSAPLSEFPVSHISNYTRNPRTEVDTMS